VATVEVDPEREAAELRAYLGPDFDRGRLERYERQLEDEYAEVGDEQRFYRSSHGYLYNLAAFAMTGTKLPYLRDLTRHVPDGAALLDYGCGIGSDGLALLEAGYRVAFADFDNPSTQYLRWRLEQRGLRAEVFDLDSRPPPDGFDLAYALDVIEHVDDPFALLGQLESLASLVMVNFLESEEGETSLHHELPIADLLDHAAAQGLVHFRRYHGRSHLVIYGGGPSSRGRFGPKVRLSWARRGLRSPKRLDTGRGPT
jgi:SAM-dependent methyltransferase